MNIKDEEDYADLVPSQNRTQPKFMEIIKLTSEPSVQVQQAAAAIPVIYDLDRAVGAQLDVLGEWVGIRRAIPVPVTGIYFAWDDADPEVGWEAGVWQGPFDPSAGPVLLNDEDYRRLIRTKILVNQWDGSFEQMSAIWDRFLPDGRSGIVVDDQNMTIRLGFEGGPLNPLQLAILQIGLPMIKPSGVRIAEVFSASDDQPIFAWDDGPGWDSSSWSILIV